MRVKSNTLQFGVLANKMIVKRGRVLVIWNATINSMMWVCSTAVMGWRQLLEPCTLLRGQVCSYSQKKNPQDRVSDVNNDQPLVGRIYGCGDETEGTKSNCDMKKDWQELWIISPLSSPTPKSSQIDTSPT